MNRRNSIKNLILASGGLIALPAWAREWSASEIASYRSSFSIEGQEILAAVADTIIPAGNSIGALSVGVDKFLQKLIDKCYDQPAQENVKTQLTGLETAAQNTYGKSFSSCDQVQREALLMKLGSSENKAEKDFFTQIKSDTIRGFNTSREVMVEHLKYKLVPGHYYGCVDVKA